MLRLAMVLALGWLFAAGPALAQGTPRSAAPEAQVVVVTDINFPPYLFQDEDGQLKGILKDKWALWSERSGVPVDLRGMEWSKAQQAVLAGEADVVEALSYREDRTKLYEYSRPYAPVEARVYFHRSISGINDVASMRGFAVGAKAGSACGNWLRERGVQALRDFATSEALVKAAAAEEVRLFCMDAPAAQYYLYKLNLADQFRQTPALYSTQFHWAVKKGRGELLKDIEQGFDRISAKELQDIDERWLGNPLRFPIGTRYLYYATAVLAAILAATALLLAWNRALRVRVAARTEELRSALQTVEKQAEAVRDLYNNAACGYHSIDAEGRIVEVNDTELAWLGRTREEVLGRSLGEFLTPESRARVPVNIESIKTHGTVQDIEYELVRKDGSTIPVLLSATALRDAQGNFLKSRSTLYDQTEQKRAAAVVRKLNEELEQREARFRSAMLHSAIGMAIATPEGRWIEVNPALCRILGRTREELLSMGFQPLTYPDDLPANLEYLRQAREGLIDSYEMEKRFLHPDGRVIWALVTVSLERDAEGKAVQMISQTQDITERKRAADEVRRLNEELEQRVRERTAELAEANRELEAFAYSVSHDLRAPLRAIDRFAQMAATGSEGKVDPGVIRALQRVRGASQRMAQLINDLLSLSQVTRAQLNRQPVDLSALATEIGAELRATEPGREVTFCVQQAITAQADLSLVRVVLDNLLRNAWKFTGKQEQARVEFGAEARDGETVYFVRDNGAGFDMQYAGKLFGAFERLHSDAEYPGTGIGLAIVERIVKRHGGRVWAEAAPGQGATFRFTLGGPA